MTDRICEYCAYTIPASDPNCIFCDYDGTQTVHNEVLGDAGMAPCIDHAEWQYPTGMVAVDITDRYYLHNVMYEALRDGDETIYLCQTHADEALAILPTLHTDRVPLILIDADSCIHCYI